MKRFLLPAFALALAVNANATSFQANMAAEQPTEVQTAKSSVTYKGKLNIIVQEQVTLDPADANIIVNEENDGTCTFILKNFSVDMGEEVLNIGDATISGLHAKEENGAIVLETTEQDAPVTNGSMEGKIKDNKVVISMKATIKDNVLNADITKLIVVLVAEGEVDSPISVTATFKSDSYTVNNTDVAQIAGSFDDEWVDCIPWDTKDNKNVVGTQPKGWHIANVSYGKMIIGEKATGNEGTKYAVKVYNNEVMGNRVPGYITLGTPWATAEANIATQVRNADGGTFGGLSFTYRPDAISFDYQRDNSKGTENATAIAYLWKGTCEQADVPGNTAVGVSSFGNATKKNMINRDRNILNLPTATGGKVTNNTTLIAKLEQSISESTKGTWKSMTIPFTYNDDTAVPEYINVIFAANDYFGDRNGIVAYNSLTIDNVKLVYYHALNSLTYNGNKVANFDEGTTEYTLNGKLVEDFDKVEFTVKGVGASYDVAKDEANNIATITVKGNDYDVNPSSKTVYTIKFDGTVGINGITTSTNSANGAIYDLSGRQLKTMQKGINIVRGKDGKMIKVMK